MIATVKYEENEDREIMSEAKIREEQELIVEVGPKLRMKNPAYGRQRISRPMRIVAPIPQ